MNIQRLIEDHKHLALVEFFPEHSFVYFVCDENLEVVYIGKTKYLYQRLYYHQNNSEFGGVFYYYIETSNSEADALEAFFIKKVKPKYNKVVNIGANNSHGKRDPKVKINTEKLKEKMKKDGVTYAGIGRALGVSRQNVAAHVSSGRIPKKMQKKLKEMGLL